MVGCSAEFKTHTAAIYIRTSVICNLLVVDVATLETSGVVDDVIVAADFVDDLNDSGVVSVVGDDIVGCTELVENDCVGMLFENGGVTERKSSRSIT